MGTTKNAYWLSAEIVVSEAKTLGFRLAQLKDNAGMVIKDIEVGYNATTQQIYVDCSRSEKGIKNDRNLVQTATINPVDGKIKLQILLDKSSLEVFANDGEKVITTMVFPEEKAIGLAAFSTGGKSILKNLKIWDLSKGN